MPLASTDNRSYDLNLEPQKRNVFVTQLNDQPTEDDDIRRFAVVKESADQLLATGINTLQKTSLLRKAVEVEEIDKELAEKREEFRQRMAQNKIKEEALMKKQEKIKERVTKFDRFLKENDAKRSRAMKKYQIEVRENKLRSKELEQIKEDVVQARERKESLLRKLELYKKYEEYLTRVIDVLPENYLEMTGENMIHNIIQRYEALEVTHNNLIDRNHTMSEQMEAGQKEHEDVKQEREKQKLVINSQMAELQNYHEALAQKVQRLEQEFGDTSSSHRSLVGELGQITMAIDNISDSCHARHFPPLSMMSYVDKLSMINQYFNEQLHVSKLLLRLNEARRSTSITLKPLPKIPTKKGDSDTTSLNRPTQPVAISQDVTKKRPGKLAPIGHSEPLSTISESKVE